MPSKTYTPKNIAELSSIIKSEKALVFVGARTSTVLPFSKPSLFEGSIVDLSCLEKEIEFISKDTVKITGPVSWGELRAALLEKGMDVGCWPTDQSALVLSGLATSATGERCFSRGMVRDHVESITYLNYKAEPVELLASRRLDDPLLKDYQGEHRVYEGFKNAPYPRLVKETDLMIGTEGQLGVIISADLKVFNHVQSSYLLVPVTSWLESDISVDYMQFGQSRRDQILSLEFFDKDCIELCGDKSLDSRCDYIVLEVVNSSLEQIVEDLNQMDDDLDFDKVLILDEKKFLSLRVSIPQSVNEYISHKNLTKMGTDAQVSSKDFLNLLEIYRSMSIKSTSKTVLFGHLGDCHLHYNFLPVSKEVSSTMILLQDFYKQLRELDASPFAEHGVGIIKLKYIDLFYNDKIRKTFKYLKEKMDPKGTFFPQGFMNL